MCTYICNIYTYIHIYIRTHFFWLGRARWMRVHIRVMTNSNVWRGSRVVEVFWCDVLTRLVSMRDTTCFYTWHASSSDCCREERLQSLSLLSVWCVDTTSFYALHDLFLCMAWRIVWHDSSTDCYWEEQLRGWGFCVGVMRWHDVCLCVTSWLVSMCDIRYPQTTAEGSGCELQVVEVLPSGCCVDSMLFYMEHDLSPCVTWCILRLLPMGADAGRWFSNCFDVGGWLVFLFSFLSCMSMRDMTHFCHWNHLLLGCVLMFPIRWHDLFLYATSFLSMHYFYT